MIPHEILKKIRQIEIRTNRIVTGMLFGTLLLCSCATRYNSTAIVPAPDLPADARINKDAGRGGVLFVTLRLENGKALAFIVDTGSPVTFFDKSLESRLGKRLGADSAWLWGVRQEASVYSAPKLYSEKVPLKTGSIVVACDLKKLSSAAGRRVMGVLGMDCLKHYCIQLDFAAGKMRFLDSSQPEAAKPGKPFPLALSNLGQTKSYAFRPYIHHSSLLGGPVTNLMIDTGLNIDGGLEPGLLREQTMNLKGNKAGKLDEETWCFRECVWEGETYTNIVVREAKSVVAGPEANVLGLRFLARHLVTFDFPNRTLYLERTRSGALSRN